MHELTQKETIALLELANNFVADKHDCRSYLHDVLNKKVDNDTHLVAADGHRLVKVVIKDCTLELPERINTLSIKNAVKVQDLSLIKPSGNDRAYPEYNRLIPEITGQEVNTLPHINAQYIAETASAAMKCNKKFTKNKYPAFKFIKIDEHNGNIFEMQFNEFVRAIFVIMPLRK